MEIYLVGGAVRDHLLGLPTKDCDWVVTGATPEHMQVQGYQAVGKDFPVFLHPETHEEYALARTERKTGKGYQGFVFHTSPDIRLEDDLIRRDLTINAMAIAESTLIDGTFPAKPAIIDPFNGQADIAAKKLRHVSSAFSEDPVRILRIARFAARYHGFSFTVADDALQMMKTMVEAGEVDALVAERVWQETEKALLEKHPEQFFLVLRACGALAVLFPEVDRLFGVPQPEKYHPEVDTGVHVMMVLQQAVKLSDDLGVRFAALTHDLGKGTTAPDILPSHHGHELRSKYLVIELCQRYRVPKQIQALAEVVAEYHGHIHKAFELKPSTVFKVLAAVSNGYRQHERLEKALLACKADARGRTGFEDRDYLQMDYMQAAYAASRDVDIKSIIDKGFSGEVIKDQIRALRVHKIKQVKQAWVDNTNQ